MIYKEKKFLFDLSSGGCKVQDGGPSGEGAQAIWPSGEKTEGWTNAYKTENRRVSKLSGNLLSE